MSEMEERTKKLMESSIIIDSLSHGPIIWTEDLVKASDEMLASEMNPWEIVPELIMRFARNVVSNDDYFSQYADAWKRSGVNCVSFTLGPLYKKPYSFEGVLHNFSFMTYLLDNRKEFFVKILKAEDIESAFKEKKKGIILNFQSMEHVGTDIDLVEIYYMQGFRIMQLTYNYKNPVGTGCTARRDKGLTEFGLKIVEKMNDLGVIIDVSHCGIQTSTDALENSKDPIICSHTFSKKLYEHDRGKPDDLLQGIAEKGGYVGVLAVAGFLTTKSETTIDDWLDHVDYIVDLIGIDHVGIGTDFYGFSAPDNLAAKISEFLDILGFRPEHKASFLNKVKGFENYAKFPNFIKGLIDRGYSDQEIKKIAGGSFLRIFRKIVG